MAKELTNNKEKVTELEYKRYLEIFEEAEEKPDRLTDWEQNFLSNIKEGVTRYELHCVLSEKQRGAMVKIEKKLFEVKEVKG